MLLLRHFSHVQLCDPMECCSPGSSVHGILHARVLEWVAIFTSRGYLDPGMEPGSPEVPALQADSLPLSHCHWGNSSLLHDNSHLILHSFVPLISLITWDLFKGKDCGQVKKAMIVSLSPAMPSPSPRCNPICFWFPHPLWIKQRLYL